MGLIAALAGGLALLSQNEPVDLALVLPDRTVIETRIESSERQEGAEWITSKSAYRVEVRAEGDLSYRTVWRDLDDRNTAEMTIITDEALVPVRIENLNEVLESVGEELAADNASTLDFLRALPPETITSLLLKDFVMVAFGQGTYLVPGERNEYRQPGGTFGDSGPLMMNASFLLESIRQGPERAVVVWINELDPDEARKALPGLIRDMFNLVGEDEESANKLATLLADASLAMRTECRYEIAVATGLAERVDCHSQQDIAIAGETRRKETRLAATQRLLN